MTVINIPFIAEVEDKSTDSPIGIFEVDWEDSYSTSTEVIDPMANDILEGGQGQENLMKNNPNAKDLYRFYSKWDKKHLAPVADFTNEEKTQLKSDIEQLLKHYPVHHIGQEVLLNKGIDMWIEAFPKEAYEYFEKLLNIAEEAIQEAIAEDSYYAMDILTSGIPGTAHLALSEGLVPAELLEAKLKDEIGIEGLSRLYKYQRINTDTDETWFACDPDTEIFDDDYMPGNVIALTSDVKDILEKRVKQAKEALEENND